ncbi:hypothetical protein QBC38DRAFT_354659 [Podospora fimiseda]|uniref:Bul1 C-terminal domain-containing protein n=1 Tax=Podospora fimiseda TaxID=252190 RepID=A0AAN7BX90_9PEZI|nr:hypothetical protein QBC38DRAFT_354659 [Podospora fimiseda]
MATVAAPSTSASSTNASHGIPQVTKSLAYPKSDVKINLRDHHSSKIYTSSSPVAGDVTIATKRDVRFDSIQIVLIGNTKASFDGLSFPQEVTHTFLKMVMPIPESIYPIPRVLETGRTYTIPFNFVIPNQLTINACSHERLSDQLQDHHVLLPPSLGGFQKDDMAPHMTKVEYVIKARVLKEPVLGGKKTRIVEATQQIQVLPASYEEAPLNITEKDKLYNMSKTKTIRKTFIGSKVGRITATASQPGPAVLAADGSKLKAKPTARINLTYDPESPAMPPPQITSISGKITSHTYYSSGTISSFPNLGLWNQPYILDRRGQFFTSVALPPISALAEQPAWTQRFTPTTRRDSGYGSESSESPGPNNNSAKAKKDKKDKTKRKSPVYLTTMLDIPFDLPTDKKTFVPTFHSCIVSRVYTLTLSIGVVAKGATGQVSLVMPLQVAIEAPATDGTEQTEGLPTFEEAAADEHLRPRVLQLPAEVPSGRASWGPHTTQAPAYEDHAGNVGGNEATTGGDELPGYGETGHARRMD